MASVVSRRQAQGSTGCTSTCACAQPSRWLAAQRLQVAAPAPSWLTRPPGLPHLWCVPKEMGSGGAKMDVRSASPDLATCCTRAWALQRGGAGRVAA